MQTPGDSGGQRSLACCSPWGSQKVRHYLAAQQHMCVCVVCVYKMEYYLAINEILPLAAKKKKAEIPSVGKEGCKATGTFIRC